MTDAVPQAGQIAPPIELPDSTGEMRKISDLLARGPVALVFYRGHW